MLTDFAWGTILLTPLVVLAQTNVFVEDDDPSLVFSPEKSSWLRNFNPQPGPNGALVDDYYHSGSYTSSIFAGMSITLTFNGSYIAYYSDLYYTHGLAEIDLDGNKTTFSTYSHLDYGTPQVLLFEAHIDPNTPDHTIKLTNLENKTMGFDYFRYTAVFSVSGPSSTPHSPGLTPHPLGLTPQSGSSPNSVTGSSALPSSSSMPHDDIATADFSTSTAITTKPQPTRTHSAIPLVSHSKPSPSPISKPEMIGFSIAATALAVILVLCTVLCLRRLRQAGAISYSVRAWRLLEEPLQGLTSTTTAYFAAPLPLPPTSPTDKYLSGPKVDNTFVLPPGAPVGHEFYCGAIDDRESFESGARSPELGAPPSYASEAH